MTTISKCSSGAPCTRARRRRVSWACASARGLPRVPIFSQGVDKIRSNHFELFRRRIIGKSVRERKRGLFGGTGTEDAGSGNRKHLRRDRGGRCRSRFDG